MNPRTILVGVGALIVLILVVRSCGDDDGGEQQEPTPTPTVAAQSTPTPVDLTGPRAAATALQNDLAALSFYNGPISGEYDAATEAAVEALQNAAGIGADGVFGPVTSTALGERLDQPGTTMALQEVLTTLCFYDGDIDGGYGPLTTAAIEAFQESAGLSPSGSFGPTTAAAFVTAWGAVPPTCAAAASEPATAVPTSDSSDDADTVEPAPVGSPLPPTPAPGGSPLPPTPAPGGSPIP